MGWCLGLKVNVMVWGMRSGKSQQSYHSVLLGCAKELNSITGSLHGGI